MQQRAEQPPSISSPGEDRSPRTSRCGRLTTASLRVDPDRLPDDPGRLLRTLPAPRGAWERGGSWGAFSGSALEVEPATAGVDRFSAVRDRAAAWTAPAAPGPPGDTAGHGRPGGPPPLPRLYGGFSFHDAPALSGCWSSFPAARFRVPAREVRLDGDDAWLLATDVSEPERGAGDEREERLRRELRRLEERLARLAVEGPAGDAPGPRGPGSRPPVRGRDPADRSGGRERWRRSVEDALEEVRRGRLEKVVLARTLDVDADAAVDEVEAFRRLRADNRRSALFFLQPSPGTAFLGASPELLGAASGSVFRATAVAGSVPRGGTAEEDRGLGRRLLASDKDRREQAIVAEEIRRCLSSRLRAVCVGSPRLLKLARIQHLESSVEARLPGGTGASRAPHLLDLIGDLHPTPAVCGRPRERALAALRRSEPFERGWYAGPVGWFGPSGRGEFVPGLRSAVLHGGRWRLFAGAGIVAGSEPEREWKETGVKFAPVLRALGVGDEP